LGTQTFAKTPNGEHQTWLFKRLGEEEAHAKDNTQSIRNARNKTWRETETGKRVPLSLPLRAQALGFGTAGLNMGRPLGSGPDRVTTQKELSAQVLRAKLPAED
jgi:hypothetical protein